MPCLASCQSPAACYVLASLCKYRLPFTQLLCCLHTQKQVVGVGVPNVLGGFSRFLEMGLENKTAPYFLQKAGYRTGLIGKCGC